jgi:hypothetical protein
MAKKVCPVSLPVVPVPPVPDLMSVHPWLIVGTVVVASLPTTARINRSPAAWVGRVGVNAVAVVGAPVVTATRETGVIDGEPEASFSATMVAR